MKVKVEGGQHHRTECQDSLRLNHSCDAAVRFGLHGLSTLCDQTLPPGFNETRRD